MGTITKIKLNDGYEIPQFGLGTWLMTGEECYNTVLTALKLGYRHIDTAEAYKNLEEIGRAIKDSNIPREEIYITSKIWSTDYKKERVIDSINYQLKALGIEYFDLMLLHKNYGNYIEAWQTLVELKADGKINSIGVSNFEKKEIDELLKLNTVIPAVNQIECHPYYQRKELKKHMAENGIILESWAPLSHGKNKIFENILFKNLAEKYNKTIAQIVLRWHIQEGNIIFPKSTNPEHLKENMDIYNFALTEEDMNKIKLLDKNGTIDKAPQFILHIVSLLAGISVKQKRNRSK